MTTSVFVESILPEVDAIRKADYPVNPLFLNRWSSRSYETRSVPDDVLYTILEAARWAPSSSNLQPWRFIVARTPEQRKRFEEFIRPNNRLWTDSVPVLLLLASDKLRADGEPNRSHAFDTGAAWASIALQARILGLTTRAVGGYDKDKARIVLDVPDEIELHAVIALGYPGTKKALHESFQDKEQPNGRRPLSESIVDGKFNP
ncbi:nitroreductase family protein [Paenibacillus periandrae]|uniref:nitroreductase family protein n=1 Tax=Paenibacillus periandrae TaxID=1761741 RepID=UPI001F09D33D|nr:nitroreductase family protein [Paenibacillus periandrae]